MNRKLSMMILTTLMALTITACACGGTTATPSPKPSAATATPLPSPVQTPEMSPMPSESAPVPSEDAEMPPADGDSTATPEGMTEGPTMMGIDVSKLILELEKLSEVDTAEVVAQGGRAIVGLNFDAQYQGTLTERIEEMVVTAVTSVEEMLTDVAVTADPTLVTEIRTLAADANGKTMTEEQVKQFDALYEKIKPAKTDDPTQK